MLVIVIMFEVWTYMMGMRVGRVVYEYIGDYGDELFLMIIKL